MTAKSKKLVLAFFIVVGLLAVPSVSAQSCDSEKLFYRFNDTVEDYSGCGNDGVNNDASFTSNSAPNTEDTGTLEFDGSSSYVDTTLRFNVSESFTVSTWFNTDTDHNGIFVEQYIRSDVASGKGFQFKKKSGGEIKFFLQGEDTQLYVSSGSVPNNEWHHGVAVFNRSSSTIKIYVDGELANSANIDLGIFTGNADKVTNLGMTDIDSNVNPLDGELDSTHIYTKALNDAEVNNLYSYDSLTAPTSNSDPSISNPNPSDGASDVSNTTDLSIDYSDPDVDSGTVTFYWQNGTQIQQNTGVSSGTTTSTSSLSLDSGTTYDWYAEATDGNGGSTSAGNYSFTTTTSSTSDESHSHNLTIYDTTNPIILPANGTSALDEGLDSQDHWQYLYFENNDTRVEHPDSSNGGWNQSQVYDSADNQLCTIQTIPVGKSSNCGSNPSDLISLWAFDQTGSSAWDYFGGLDGSLNSVTQGSSGQFGRSYSFDGSSSYVNIGNPSEVQDENLDGGMALTAWVKTDDTSSKQRIIVKGSSSANDNYGIEFEDSDDDGVVELEGYIDNSGADDILKTPFEPSENTWHHVAMTFDGSSAYMYADGEQVASYTSLNSNIADASGSPLVIGARGAGDSQFFSGSIDQVRIYDNYISSSKVKAMYSNTQKVEPATTSTRDSQGKVIISSPDASEIEKPSFDLQVSAKNFDAGTWKYDIGQGNKTFTPNITVSNVSEGSKSLTVWANNASNTSQWFKSTASFNVDYKFDIFDWQQYEDVSSNVVYDNFSVILDQTGQGYGSYNSTVESFSSRKVESVDLKYTGNPKWDDWTNHTSLITHYKISNPLPFTNDSQKYMMTLNSTRGQSMDIYERTGVDSWSVYASNVADTEINDICRNGEGDLIAYNGDDSGVYAYTPDSSDLKSWSQVNHVNSSDTDDPGCFYSEEQDLMHLYYEYIDAGGQSADYIGHSTSPNGVTDWTVKENTVDATDDSYKVGDPRFAKIGNIYHMMLDTHNDGNGLGNVTHFYSKNLTKFREGKIVLNNQEYPNIDRFGDLMPRYIDEAGKWKGYYETRSEGTSIYYAESDGPLVNNISAKIEYDSNNDSFLESSTNWIDLEPNYSETWSSTGNNRVFNRSSADIHVSGYSFRKIFRLGTKKGDKAGLSSSNLDLQSFTEDTTPPSSSDNWTPSGFVDKSEVDVELTASDNSGGSGVANISYRVNGGSYTTVSGSSTVVTISQQQNNTLEYYATDNAGNVEEVNPEYVALNINEAPTASFSFNPSDPVVDETISFDASGSNDPDGSIVSYEWDWTNDGTFEESGQTVSHSYSSSSNFNAVLKVTDDDGATDTVSNVVEVASGSVDNPAPEVNLSLNATDIVVGDSVQANVSASDDGNISMLELDWEGDGVYDESGFVNEFTATNIYNESGIYSVTARAEDNEGKETLESVTVNVDNVRTSTNKSIITSCENSTGSDGFCLENRSDETSIQGFTNDDTYTFEASVDVINSIVGEFTLFGFVNTTSGRNDGVESGKVNVSVSDESSVVNDPPTAEYSISPTDPTPGESISFDGSLSSDADGSIVSYEWDWTNDGAIDDTGVNPSHSYGSEGDYTVRLVVTDDEGATSTYTNTVPVQSEDSGGGGGDDGDGDNGGGSIGDPGDGDSTNEASADGSSVNLISPKSQTKFVGDSLTLDESASEDTTVTIGGSDNTFELVEIIDGNTAKIELNGFENHTLDIGEEIPGTFGVNEASRVYLSGVTDTQDVSEASLNIYGTGYFADDTARPYYSYNYSLDGAADVSLLIKNTEDSSFTEVDSFSSNSAVNGTQTFVGNESSGIYEAKLELNTENSTVETDKVGFYLGKVPVIDILRPSNGVTIERPAAQSNVSAPLDFEFRLANNVSSNISTYYEGVGTGKRFDGNIESVDVRNREDGILETFVRKGLNLAFSWTDKIQFEPDVDVQGNSSVYISEKGGFDGFVNVSVFGEDNSVSARSVPISIDVVGLNYRNESERRDYFDSRDGDSEQSFVLSPSVNESVGNNSSVRYFDSRFAVFEPNPDKRFEVRDLGNFDVGIDFDFVVNASDSSQVNRSLFVESVNGSKVVERELNPLQAQHFETLDESDFNGSWSEGKYRVYGKTFYENGSVLQTVDPDHSFYVQDATPGLIEYTFGSIVEALTTVYDFTTDRAGLLIALFGVGGWYAGFKSRNYDFLARWGALGLFAFFSGWIPGGPVYIPGSIQAVVLTVAAATVTLKFLRGDITL